MTAVLPLPASDFDLIRTLVRGGSGIVLEDGKGYLVQARLDALARRLGLGTTAGLVAELRRGGAQDALREQVVEAMTTNETSFFRDLHPFEALRTVVLPDLIARRARQKSLRIWCGAASTGQEPYTLALLLKEHFAAPLAGWDVRIDATDLSGEVLDRARGGRYAQIEVNRGLPITYLVKYFTRDGSEWVLNADVRRMVEFRPLNLIERWPPMPPPDLVMMRNVLIYFDLPTKQKILAGVRRLIKPDGYLFLGGSETTMNIDPLYVRQEVGKSVCYRPPGCVGSSTSATPPPKG
jgi:chemotaxis protein methyltransferase CheR